LNAGEHDPAAREITLRDVRKPGWGETIYNFKSPEERFAQLIAQDSQDMDDEISRTEEFMCAGCMCDDRRLYYFAAAAATVCCCGWLCFKRTSCNAGVPGMSRSLPGGRSAGASLETPKR
jgi:Phage major capsid protein E